MSDWKPYIPTCTWVGDLAAAKYEVGDNIRINEVFDENYGMVGKIIRKDDDDDSYLIEFEYDSPMGKGINTSWYYGTGDFVLANKPTYAPKPIGFSYCVHTWREDKWFTAKVYKTCTKCGARFEDV